MIRRTIQSRIESDLFQSKAIIIYGARQVGKTTLIRQVAGAVSSRALYLNCDELDVKERLTGKTSTELKRLIGNHGQDDAISDDSWVYVMLVNRENFRDYIL